MLEFKIGKIKNLTDEIIRIKFCADGTIVARKVKLINITFTIINEGKHNNNLNGFINRTK